MKTIIAGSRNITSPYTVINAIFNAYFKKKIEITKVVCGGAKGVDTLGECYADTNSIPVKKFIPDWDKYGRGAGFKRNIEMAKYADALIAVWDGESRGTLHMIKEARKRNLKVFVYRSD